MITINITLVYITKTIVYVLYSQRKPTSYELSNDNVVNREF